MLRLKDKGLITCELALQNLLSCSSKSSLLVLFRVYLAPCVCFLLLVVWYVSNVPLSTQQNSLRLCCTSFHRNVISSLQPGQSVSLAMVARQYLCPFSVLHCSCIELRPEKGKVFGKFRRLPTHKSKKNK